MAKETRREIVNRDFDRYNRYHTDRILENDIVILKARANVSRLTTDIEINKYKKRLEESRKQQAEELRKLLERMHRERAKVLEQISACFSEDKDGWHKELSDIDLAHSGAFRALDTLREKVWTEKIRLGKEPFERLDARPNPFSPGLYTYSPGWWLDEETEQKKKKSWDALGSINSELGLLIRTRSAYKWVEDGWSISELAALDLI